MLDSLRDQLVPHIAKLKTAREMFNALKRLFENSSTSRVLALRQQLQNTKMARGDSVASFFMKIYDLRDRLGTMGEIIADWELVMIALNGLPVHWEPFIQSVSGRSKLPKFDRLWVDCTQEDTRLAARGGAQPEENQALTTHARKGNGLQGKVHAFPLPLRVCGGKFYN